MKIQKTFTVYAPQQAVWQFITHPERIAPCIPGCEGAEEIRPGVYKATIQVKVGPIKTAFSVDIERIQERPPEFAAYDTKGEEGSHASRIKATSTLTLKPLAAEMTEVSYASDITIMGRLGKFGAGMMQKIADGIGDEFVAALKDRLDDKVAAQAAAGGQVPVEKASAKAAILWWAIGIGIGIAALLWYLL
jgi:carbon monoxide dehydrogenase subunit G